MLKKERVKLDPSCKFVCLDEYPHDREAATDVLTGNTGDDTTAGLNKTKIRRRSKRSSRRSNGKTYEIAPQFPMIVATVASNLVNPLLSCR